MSPDHILDHEFACFVRDLRATTADETHSKLPDGEERKADLLAVLTHHEQVMRRALQEAGLRPAYEAAVWDAVWQLRKDIAEACERAQKATADARWARED